VEGQEFLYKAIEEQVEDGLDVIQHLSRTTLVPIKKFPAVVIEDEPYDFTQELGGSEIVTKVENCNLFIIIKSVNTNELSEAKYLDGKQRLEKLTLDTMAVILERVPTYNKIGSLKFGRGEMFDGIISSIPVMYNIIPVELIIIAN